MLCESTTGDAETRAGLAEARQTPMPYIIAVHMKQATTMLLFRLPFTLVDALSWKMVPLMFFIALIYMGQRRTI